MEKTLNRKSEYIDIGREKDFLATTAEKERLRIRNPWAGKLSIGSRKTLHFGGLTILGAATAEE